jgi:hypothetical protein
MIKKTKNGKNDTEMQINFALKLIPKTISTLSFLISLIQHLKVGFWCFFDKRNHSFNRIFST